MIRIDTQSENAIAPSFEGLLAIAFGNKIEQLKMEKVPRNITYMSTRIFLIKGYLYNLQF